MSNMNDRKCPICGKSLEGYHYNAIYCSRECKKENEKAKIREKNLQKRLAGKICPKCGNKFIPKQYGTTRRYCFDCVPDNYWNNQSDASIRNIIKKWALEYKGNKCSICGYERCSDALEFHHLDDNEKDFNISDRKLKQDWPAIKAELDKCILVCANCHRELHSIRYKDTNIDQLIEYIKTHNKIETEGEK